MKTSRILIVLLFCSLVHLVYAQAVTENDYYNFMNAISGPDSTQKVIISGAATIPSLISDSNTIFHGNFIDSHGNGDTVFKPADIKYMKSQFAKLSSYSWKSNKIKWADIVSEKGIDKLFDLKKKGDAWTKFEKKFHQHVFYDYSIPVFSADKSICAIYVGHHCGGLCGEGNIYVYQYKNGKWVVIRMYFLWIS